VQEQLSRFSEYFAEVFSSEDINAEQQQHMEQLITDMQQTLNTCSSPGSDDGTAESTAQQKVQQQQEQRVLPLSLRSRQLLLPCAMVQLQVLTISLPRC